MIKNYERDDDSERDFFYHLKVLKEARFSDIDNYLITNGVKILERCNIGGFVIVSSDKDYLPVMRIASYRKVKSELKESTHLKFTRNVILQILNFLE